MLKKLTVAVLLVSIQRALELRHSRKNERLLRERGAVERGQEHYPIMVGIHSLWLVATLVEGIKRRSRPRYLPFGLFLLVQPLRYWVISTLGEYWNTRILVVPGTKLVRRGPYKYLKHPNYLVVAIEILSFPLIFGAWLTAIIFSAANAGMLFVRIREEERALEELAE